MAKDNEQSIKRPVGQDVLRRLTNADLCVDAAKIVQQVDQHYVKNEVEVTVMLSFKGGGAVAISTSCIEPERLRYHLERAKAQIPDFDLRSKQGRIIT